MAVRRRWTGLSARRAARSGGAEPGGSGQLQRGAAVRAACKAGPARVGARRSKPDDDRAYLSTCGGDAAGDRAGRRSHGLVSMSEIEWQIRMNLDILAT